MKNFVGVRTPSSMKMMKFQSVRSSMSKNKGNMSIGNQKRQINSPKFSLGSRGLQKDDAIDEVRRSLDRLNAKDYCTP